MSMNLPFRGSLTPMHSLMEPITPMKDIRGLNERLNTGAVDLSNSLGDFVFLNTDLQSWLAKQSSVNLH
jgi:hypothetical protein